MSDDVIIDLSIRVPSALYEALPDKLGPVLAAQAAGMQAFANAARRQVAPADYNGEDVPA